MFRVIVCQFIFFVFPLFTDTFKFLPYKLYELIYCRFMLLCTYLSLISLIERVNQVICLRTLLLTHVTSKRDTLYVSGTCLIGIGVLNTHRSGSNLPVGKQSQ